MVLKAFIEDVIPQFYAEIEQEIRIREEIEEKIA